MTANGVADFPQGAQTMTGLDYSSWKIWLRNLPPQMPRLKPAVAPLVALLCLVIPNIALAQICVSNGPEGGIIESLAVDPVTPSTVDGWWRSV